jgi:hypothetical protein
MAHSLPVINLTQAKFECTYGRGCEGLCCRDGRPLMYPDEIACLNANLHKFLPALRPEARAVVEKKGYLTPRRRRLGERITRTTSGWCVFFNQGCVLHKIGAAEGDKFKYKPAVCALWPLQQDEHDQWYVRQKHFKGERWNIFCLDPEASAVPAAESLQDEITLALRFHEEAKASGQAQDAEGSR